MIGHIRERIINTMATWERVTLVTCGPAGPQMSMAMCQAVGMTLYVLVQRASDHLYNLEQPREVVLRAAAWEARGIAQALPDMPAIQALMTRCTPRPWEAWIEVHPARLQRLSDDGLSVLETIDL